MQAPKKPDYKHPDYHKVLIYHALVEDDSYWSTTAQINLIVEADDHYLWRLIIERVNMTDSGKEDMLYAVTWHDVMEDVEPPEDIVGVVFGPTEQMALSAYELEKYRSYMRQKREVDKLGFGK